MRRVGILLVAGVTVLAGLAGGAAPAEAHNICAQNPPDASGGCYYDHQRFRWCDRGADGNYVQMRYTRSGVSGYLYTGFASGGYNTCEEVSTSPGVTEIWLCIQNEGCGLGVRH